MTATTAVRGHLYLVKGFGQERYVNARSAFAAISKFIEQVTV